MNNILVISEDTIRSNSEISDNIWGKSLLPAIRTAQEIYLEMFLGSCLYNKILNLISTGEIGLDANIAYKNLLDTYITPFMIERVVADLIPIIGNKITNLGVFKSDDEYAKNTGADEVDRLYQLHVNKSDHYAKRMQQFLKSNMDIYPELDVCNCGDVKPCLDSSADCSIWLGGTRGKYVRF